MAEHELRECASAIAEAAQPNTTVVILTGAGVSSESGVPTYRGHKGLWGCPEVRALAEARVFRRTPRLAWALFQQMRETLSGLRPNAAHYALAEMDELLRPQARAAVITQNVDSLHQAAGSRRVVELHGNASRFHCTICGCLHDCLPMQLAELPPRCACGGIIRPDIVLFGEPLPAAAWQEAQSLVERAVVLIVVGTSLEVEPAASLPIAALQRGILVVEINLDPTALTRAADYSFRGFAGHLVPLLVRHLGAALGRSLRHASLPRA